MSPKAWFIVGAGDFGRECASWAKAYSLLSGVPFAGFLADDATSLDTHPHYRPGVVGPASAHAPREGAVYVMAISDPRAKLTVADILTSRGARFVTVIHPSAILADHVTLGDGVVVCPNVVISCDTRILDFVAINLGSTVGHDVRIGRGATVSAHVDLTGHVTVDEGAFLGSHAVVLPKGRVGAYARVGAGSVVLRSVKPGVTVMGVPARQVSA